MANRIQIRRDSAANFTAANPILAQGEPALEIDTLKEKIGNGVDTYADLIYRNEPVDISGKEDKDQKGAPGGYAPLNAATKLTAAYLEIVNDLTTGGAEKLLSAEQGKLLKGQIDGINTLLASDNLNLDTIQEIVDAIENVQSSFDTILVNDLTTGGTTKALTAEQGKVLKDSFEALLGVVNTNSNKTGITAQQAADIETNNSKISFTAGAAVAANSAKVGITTGQAAEIAANSSKTGITTQQAADITANNSKISFTAGAAVAANTAKMSFSQEERDKLASLNYASQRELTVSGSITVSDNGGLIWVNSATPITITVDHVGVENYYCEVWNIGAGAVTFISGTGTVSAIDGAVILEQNKTCMVVQKLTTVNYYLKGELE